MIHLELLLLVFGVLKHLKRFELVNCLQPLECRNLSEKAFVLEIFVSLSFLINNANIEQEMSSFLLFVPLQANLFTIQFEKVWKK